jgi:hypothetical protein
MNDIDGIHAVLEVLAPHWNQIEADFDRHNNRFLELASADHDAIGRVLRAHLVIESFLDTFLRIQYDLESLEQLRLSFYQKALLLPAAGSSAAFVRPGILQLNALRNKFGHELNHQIGQHEVSAIYAVLQVARAHVVFESPLDAIEAFAPIACAFLSVPPPHLQALFMEAFSKVKSYVPETVANSF